MDTHDKIEVGAPVMTPKGPGLVRRRWIDESSGKWQVHGVWFAEADLTLLQPVTRPASEELEVEPTAWMYQHDETGEIGFIDAWQIEQGFWGLNPKLQRICPLYRHPPAPVDPEKEEQAADAAERAGTRSVKITHTWGPLDFGEYLRRKADLLGPLNCSEATPGPRASLKADSDVAADRFEVPVPDFNAIEARVAALYAPEPLDNTDLQTAIDNTAHWLTAHRSVTHNTSEVVLEVYQTHLAALLEIQRLRAGHCPKHYLEDDDDAPV